MPVESKAEIFYTLDLCSGLWQVGLDKSMKMMPLLIWSALWVYQGEHYNPTYPARPVFPLSRFPDHILKYSVFSLTLG